MRVVLYKKRIVEFQFLFSQNFIQEFLLFGKINPSYQYGFEYLGRQFFLVNENVYLVLKIKVKL